MLLSKVFVVVSALVLPAMATPMTVVVPANEVECFYADINTQGTKVGVSYTVQAGGSFDIDFQVKGPNGEVLYSQQKEKDGEYSFAARLVGEYQFCLSNDMSTFTDKTVEFELSVESDFKATLPDQVGKGGTDNVEQSITTIEQRANNILRSLYYYKTRNSRNQSTVQSTETRIFYFSIFEVALMVGMAALQVIIVQLFFKGSRKQLV